MWVQIPRDFDWGIFRRAAMSQTTVRFCRYLNWAPPFPDGVYHGEWGGYVVRFEVAGRPAEMKIERGIKTVRAPCRVTISAATWPKAIVEPIGVDVWEKESGRVW